MDDMTAFERQIGDELRHEIGSLPRFDAMEIVRTTTTTSPKWRFQSMFSATKFVVAGVIVALFGGFLLMGVLTTQQGDDVVPAAVTASPSPETDLLPGVDLVTEEVEPGVERILSDGIRDLSVVGVGRERGRGAPDGLAIAPDGAVWLDRGSTLVKLGDPNSFPRPSTHWPDLKVSPDGTLWARTGESSIGRLEGEGWSEMARLDSSMDSDAWWDFAPDGTVWTGRSGARVARLGASGWQDHPIDLDSFALELRQLMEDHGASPFTVGRGPYFEDLRVDTNGDVWAALSVNDEAFAPMVLLRYDGETWSLVDPVGVGGYYTVDLLDVGSDGTMWVHLQAGRNARNEPEQHYLARLADDRWTVFSEEDGVGELVLRAENHGLLRVDSSGAVWTERLGRSSAVRVFDGKTWRQYLDSHEVIDLEVAPDGKVWVLASDHLYVIDPDTPPSSTTTPDSTTTPLIELPAEIPEGIESGTLDTPLGPARWVHLSGDDESLPGGMKPIPVPGGFVTFDEEPHPYETCSASERCQYVWFSPDLFEWTRRPLPVDVEYAQAYFSGGHFWLIANDETPNEDGDLDPPALWRSSDAQEWEAVELDGLESPFPATIDWRAYLGEIAASGDATVAQVTFEAQVGKNLLGLPPRPEGEDKVGDYASLQPDNGDSYLVMGPYDDAHGWVRFEVTGDGVRVLDAATDAVLTDIPGIGMGFIESWAASGEAPSVSRLVRLEGGRVETIELPSADPGGDQWTPRTLFASDDGFRWFRPSADGLTHLWVSADGREWTLEDTFGDDPGEPAQVTQGREGLESWAWSEPRQVADLIASSDGLEWQVNRAPSADIVLRFGDGWIVPGRGGLAFYADGSDGPAALGSVELPLKTDSFGAGGYGMSVINANTIVHSVVEEEDFAGRQRDHWIITFDDLPASGRS